MNNKYTLKDVTSQPLNQALELNIAILVPSVPRRYVGGSGTCPQRNPKGGVGFHSGGVSTVRLRLL